MKASELRELTIEELEAKSSSFRLELFNARVRKATGQLENTALLGNLKRNVARVETLLNEKRGASQ
jgi:large subunit ribosomal protein L29